MPSAAAAAVKMLTVIGQRLVEPTDFAIQLARSSSTLATSRLNVRA